MLTHCLVIAVFWVLTSCARDLQCVTVDTEPHDGLKRFLWSANVSGIHCDVIPKYDDKTTELALLKNYLKPMKRDENLLYCNSRFLSIAGSSDEIVSRWKRTGIDVLIDMSVENEVLQVSCILGKISHVSKIASDFDSVELYKRSSTEVTHKAHNYYKTEFITDIFNQKNSFVVGHDLKGLVFLNMNQFPGMVGYTSDKMKFFNFETNDSPPILVGSLSTYQDFIRLTNYVPGVFDASKIGVRKRTNAEEYKPMQFFMPTNVSRREYFDENEERYQTMVTALFIKEDVPLLDLVLDRFKGLSWKSPNRVFMIFSKVAHREHHVKDLIESMRTRNRFMATIFYDSASEETQSNAKMHEAVLRTCIEYNCTWIWTQDSNVVNVNFYILQDLAMLNFSFSAPLILSDINVDSPSTNFWGATVENGFYKRSVDYFDIAERKIGGIFAVPYVSGAYLMKASATKDIYFSQDSYWDTDSDVVLCKSIREAGHLIMLMANHPSALFINGRSNDTVAYPFLEHFPENMTPFYLSFYFKWDHVRQRDWKYNTATPIQNPCTDVYVMELFDPNFAKNMISASTHSNLWTNREWFTGWEAIETLSLDDIGFEKGWEAFSKDYLPTIVDRKFTGFRSDGHPIFSFVMRADNKTTQSTDALAGRGTYTILVALTTEHEGGGLYINDQCKLNLQVGDFVIYPSRLTHSIRFVPPKVGTMMNIVSFFR